MDKKNIITKNFLLYFFCCNILVIFLSISCEKPNEEKYFTPSVYKIEPISKKERAYWPTKEWKNKSINNSALKEKIEEIAFPQYNASVSREEQATTNALLVIKDSHIIYEKYANEFSKNSSHILWSVSKSITSTLFGIAIYQNKIKSVDEFVHKYYPPYSVGKKKLITFRNFLNMTSGINWNEAYADKPFFFIYCCYVIYFW